MTSQRNLNTKNINDFELGYAPNSWNDLYNYLSKVEKFPLKLILSAGLVVSKDNTDKVYDRFRNCLLYTSPSPRDQRGSRMPSSA